MSQSEASTTGAALEAVSSAASDARVSHPSESLGSTSLFYRSPVSGSGEPLRGPETHKAPTHRKGTKNGATAAQLAAERYALAHHLKEAVKASESLCVAAKSGDPVGLGSAASELRTILKQVWGKRQLREDTWRECVNFVQAALSASIAEQLTISQAQALRAAINDHVAAGVVAEAGVLKLAADLQKVGLDPWAGISRDPQ